MRNLSDKMFVLVAALLIAAPAQARPADPAAVKALLGAHDGTPMPAETWRKLGDDVDQLLAQAALDGAGKYVVRGRAMATLGTLGGDTAYRTLIALLDDKSTPEALLGTAYTAYATGFAATHNDDVLARGARLLAHPDFGVRIAAARALGRVGTVGAAAILRSRRAIEGHPAVVREIARALGEK